MDFRSLSAMFNTGPSPPTPMFATGIRRTATTIIVLGGFLFDKKHFVEIVSVSKGDKNVSKRNESGQDSNFSQPHQGTHHGKWAKCQFCKEAIQVKKLEKHEKECRSQHEGRKFLPI